MSDDTVTVKVIREHFGDQGHQVEGSQYATTAQHARELEAQKLVTIEGAAKGEPAPANKAEPAPANKVEKAAPTKSKAPAK